MILQESRRLIIGLVLAVTLTVLPVLAREIPPPAVNIVTGDTATAPEIEVAKELARTLQVLYPKSAFRVSRELSANDAAIYIGTPNSAPLLMEHIGMRKLSAPESYIVTTSTINGQTCGVIAGADPKGVAYGVYGLLKHLGCGFYLSFDTLPGERSAPFSFAGWDLADRPLVPTRMVFNWHNFLSGCSTWDLPQWKSWIAQSQKMGYNAVMVHAYGNNPMAGFELGGIQKPVGFLTSTRVGRDWSTNHVNDVRRLWGGEVFDSPVFGSVAAIEGTDKDRTDAAQKRMAGVFDFAERRGVDVYFAVDIDTLPAHPQELVLRLPDSARFQVDVADMSWMGQHAGKAWLPNPDTPQGYGFFRAQVEQLLQDYPGIDCLVAWHRREKTPWMDLRRENMRG
jgi:hypothetical protein